MGSYHYYHHYYHHHHHHHHHIINPNRDIIIAVNKTAVQPFD